MAEVTSSIFRGAREISREKPTADDAQEAVAPRNRD